VLFRLRSQLLLSAALVVAVPAMAGTASAGSFIVDFPSTLTNGGFTIDGDDSLAITNTGSISTTGNFELGVQATGANNTITQSGSIATSGNLAHGVYNGGDSSTIAQSGTIVTSGSSAWGVLSFGDHNTFAQSGSIATNGFTAKAISSIGDNNKITQSGSIVTSGVIADGVQIVGDKNTVTQSGSIVTSGYGAHGIFSIGDNNTFIQSGSIATNGFSAHGVDSNGDNNTIIQSGSISTAGDDAHGIFADGVFNVVNNSGAISAQGLRGKGINAGDDNTITNSGAITTSGRFGYGMEVRDKNTVSNSGSIATSGESAQGIYAQQENVITNSGVITTSGDRARGIVADEENTIANSGAIATTGDGSAGILAGDGNTITNTGSITTTGNPFFRYINSAPYVYSYFADGISAGSNNSITNSGSISTKGELAHGISAEYENAIVNSGSITTSGNEADGIYAYDNNTISHSGSIATSGKDAHGIHVYNYNAITSAGSIQTAGNDAHAFVMGSANTISVSGRIFTSGEGANGIRAGYCGCIGYGDDNEITISGSVISARSLSIAFYGYDNVLNLNAPAFLGGKMQIGTNTTVNVVTGPGHSILWDFSTGTMAGGAPNISGSVPWFYDPVSKKLATFDPSDLSAASLMLDSISGNVSALIQGRLAGPGGAFNPAAVSSYVETQQSAAQSRLDAAFGEGSSTNGGLAPVNAPGFWIAGFASQYDYQGTDTVAGSDIGYSGFAIGADADVTADLRAGILGGWGRATIGRDSFFTSSFAQNEDDEAEGAFGAVYARARSGAFFVDAALSGGLLDHSLSRFVNDNLAYLGNSSAEAETSSWWLSPEIAAGLNLDGGNGWVYTPAARLRYAMQTIDGYSETGASAGNATIDDQDLAVAEGRLEIAASRQMDSVLFTGRLGWLTQWSPSDNEASVTMLGITQTISADGADRSAGFAGVDLTVVISDALDFTAAGEATFGSDITGGRFSAGFVAKF
jgi:uncharacterized protein YhjY with autotransporter beta-barrel domain